MCNRLNDWILSNSLADGYIDLAALHDELDPSVFPEGYSVDGVHLTEKAQIKLVDLIPEKLFDLGERHIKTLEAIIAERLAHSDDSSQKPGETQTGTAQIIQPVTDIGSGADKTDTVKNTQTSTSADIRTEATASSNTEALSEQTTLPDEKTDSERSRRGVIYAGVLSAVLLIVVAVIIAFSKKKKTV